MKKSILLLFAAFATLVASAHDFEVDGIYYNIISETDKTVEVTYKGDNPYEGGWYSGSITIPATVTYDGVAYSVTSIGGFAFYNCSSLTTITIPEGVTSIGEGTFLGCSSLTAITIPEGVTRIGSHAFSGCSSLTAITIPEGVTSIGDDAFLGCSSLTAINIPEGVTSIGDSAFLGCRSLTAITLPEGVTSIGNYAFSSCRSLNAITIPEGVTSIGRYAFDDCRSLTAITLPEGVTSIGDNAFYKCSSLKTIINCSDLPLQRGSYDYGYVAYYADRVINVNEVIDGYAFKTIKGVHYLMGYIGDKTELTLPADYKGENYQIGDDAFLGCSSLTAITIPESVTSIGSYAFYGCSSLTTIVLPKSVRSIDSSAFANCFELTDVYCYAESVPSTATNAFDGSYPEYATLHVPAGAINSYKSKAPWSSFGTIKTIENVTLEKCATPSINYKDGKIVFACDTEGAIVESSFKDNSASDYNDMEVAFIPTYTLTAYATKEKYENSDVATLTLCWVPCDENHEESDGIVTIPSHPVLISTQGGVITVSGLAEGTEVAVYTTAGTEIATATATDGTATLTTGLEAGSIAIVKIGNYSIKVAIK